MAELAVELKSPAKFDNNEMFQAGARVRVAGRARECLKLVRNTLAVPVLVEAVDMPNRVDGLLLPSTIGSLRGEPQTLEATRKRYKEQLLKRAQELALTTANLGPKGKSWSDVAAEADAEANASGTDVIAEANARRRAADARALAQRVASLSAGKSWFDIAAEERWAKLEARREADRAAEEAAEVELHEYFKNEAIRQEAEAETLVARARQLREQAARATELVSFEAATRAVKVARDTVATFESLNDPRVVEAKERLAVAEAKFAEAEQAKRLYEARVKLYAAQQKLGTLGVHGSLYPRDRLKKGLEASNAGKAAIDAGDLAAFDTALAELVEWCPDAIEPSEYRSRTTAAFGWS